MRNKRVKSECERGIIQKKIFLHTNMLQQWLSMLSTPKEFVKGDKKETTSYMLHKTISLKILKVSAPTL